MAKRRRLETPDTRTPDTRAPDILAETSAGRPGGGSGGRLGGISTGLETKSITRLSGTPPIADIAGEAATLNAAEGALAEIAAARADGRLVIGVGLAAIDAGHLIRDRMGADDDEMDALKLSIAAHGQRMALDLIDTGDGRYGLISGWRRLSALRALHAETGEDRFATALAVLRRPEDSGAAYIAMVEENEIRAGLSYYERARIAALAAEAGAFADAAAAVNALYAAGSKARRSKIRGFLLIHEVLGAALRFPAEIPERMGADLVQAIRQGHARALLAALAPEADSPEAEAAALAQAMRGQMPAKSAPPETQSEIIPGIAFHRTRGRLILSGPGVDAALEAKLAAFLKEKV